MAFERETRRPQLDRRYDITICDPDTGEARDYRATAQDIGKAIRTAKVAFTGVAPADDPDRPEKLAVRERLLVASAREVR